MRRLHTVFVDVVAVGQQGSGVAECEVAVEHVDKVVGLAHRSRQLARHIIICVGVEERRLDECQEGGRRDGACGEVLRSTIVEDVAVDLGKRHIEACGELVDDIDVGVETHVQTVEAVFLSRALSIGIAQREIVHTDVVTTLHVDVVILVQRRAVDLLLPVGVVVILGVVILRLIIDEELEYQRVGVVVDVRIGAQHLSGIEAVLAGIHHVRCLWHQRDAHADVGIDAGSHRVATLRLDEHYAVGTLGAVEGSGVLQHRHLLDVLRVDVQQEVGVVAIVQRGTCLLHVLNDAVDDEEGLCVGVE